MLMPLQTFDWQVLRRVLREPGRKAVVGRALRLIPSRRTKDGSFLNWFVSAGLLRVVKDAADPFERTFAITETGMKAADFGEFELTPGAVPNSSATPVPAAEKAKTRAAR